jgi:HEAT repeat protein
VAIFHRPLPRTREAALRDMREDSSRVRRSAVADLARLAGEDADSRVLEALRKALGDDDAVVRTEAAYALGDARSHEALAALLVAMEDEHASVRQAAIDAIGLIGEPAACGRLERAVRDERADVRFQALIALARVAPDVAREAALGAASDPDARVRYVAVRVVEELAAGRDARTEERIALEEPAARAARGWLGDEDAAVRLAAAVLLARAGDGSGAREIVQVVGSARAHAEPEDEAAAVELAGVLGLGEATAGLERRAFGLGRFARERFSFLALVALARMGHERARRSIVRDLAAWSRDRRTMAVSAAGKACLREARARIEAMLGDEQVADQEAVAEALGQLNESRS